MLSDKKKRDVYDKYGEEGLSGRMGGGGGGGNNNFSYQFHGDPKATFAEFFGTSNPFESFFNMPGMGGNPHQVNILCEDYIFHRFFCFSHFSMMEWMGWRQMIHLPA